MRVQHEFGLTKSIRSTAASILDYLFVNIVASAEPQTPAFVRDDVSFFLV